MKAAIADEFRQLRAEGVRVHSSKPRGNDPKKVRDLNTLLRHIYDVHDKPLRDKDFPKYFKVFQTLSSKLHDLMKQVDPYYERYSVVRFAGRKDRLRINKPDEFDMEIVIGLPVVSKNPESPENSNVDIEDVAPGFVQLRIGEQLQNLHDGEEWQIMQTAYRWLDADNYLLRSLFIDWFKSVVDKALNLFDVIEDNLPFTTNIIIVEGQTYTLRLLDDISPTLIVEAPQCGFRLDVDLVPALELLDKDSTRMPSKRRKCGNFVVVPKPLQRCPDGKRAWRLPLKLQEEWQLLYMKQTIRLIKKLRDCQGLNKIASYYLNTMFYHEAVHQERDPDFWSRDVPAGPFVHMLKKFHQYLENKNIPYFWNADFNLIGDIDESTLDGYAKKLKRIIHTIEDPSEYKKVAKFLMSESQFKEYKKNILNV